MPWGYTVRFICVFGSFTEPCLFCSVRVSSKWRTEAVYSVSITYHLCYIKELKCKFDFSQRIQKQSRKSHLGFQWYFISTPFITATLILSLSHHPGVYATSRHIPGVRFAGVTHPGLIGTAPSPELLATWNEREVGLIQANASAVPPVGFAPLATGAYVGQELDPKTREKIYKEGARTIPGREHGGNCDVGF
jgi:Acetamidase/Formamidase family